MLAPFQLIGIALLIYTLVVLSLSLFQFKKVLLSFLRKQASFLIFSIISSIVLILSQYIPDFYLYFTVSEFLLAISLFYNYLKSNIIYFSIFAIFSYLEDIMIILSIYFSFYISGSILKTMFDEHNGSKIILLSFLLLDTSFVAQAFYILRLDITFIQIGITTYTVSLIFFMIPLILRRELDR